VIYLTVSQSFAGNLKDLVIYAMCFGRLQRTVVHLHGGAGMPEMRFVGRALRALNAVFLRRLGAAIVLGESLREIYRGIVPDDRIHVVPNFAEDGLFTSQPEIRSKFDQPEPLRVLFLSNLLPGKGHEELVDAFLGLDERVRALMRVDLAGAFESERARESLLEKVKGDDRLVYHGTVTGERKRALLNQAHVLCLPTYYAYEGQPISLLEAYASGCAVITTDHGGISDVFQDGVNGLQVKKRSVHDLRRALQRAVCEPERLRQMAIANLAAALATFRTATYQRSVLQIIDAVARR